MLGAVWWSYRGNNCRPLGLGPRWWSWRCGLALLGVALLGCGSSTRRGPDDEETDPNGTEQAGDESSRVVVGCRQKPLSLGAISSSRPPSPEVVWMDADFAVGWASPDGYRVTITNGRGISNELTLPLTPSVEQSPPAQLFWTGAELRLYYALGEELFLDVLARQPTFAVTETRAVGVGLPFRAVQMAPERIAVLTPGSLYLDGAEIPRSPSYTAPARVGWNGESFLISSVLGHGAWKLNGLTADGAYQAPAIDLTWCGICATGEAAGSTFASSEVTGRHAVVVATSEEIVLAIGDLAPIKRAPVAKPEAFGFWDGARYVLLLADQDTPSDAGNRNLGLLAVTSDGIVLSETGEATAISRDPADERIPVGAAAAPGDYGIAWVRGEELLFQRCSLVER
jgi:hypothetical protein